jgi:molybdopterin converting factor subunit 1
MGAAMKVRVLLFARARDLAGRDMVEVEIPAGATVADLRERLGSALPGLKGFVQRCVVAVGGEYAAEGDEVREGAEVALIPPVSGGSGEPRGSQEGA